MRPALPCQIFFYAHPLAAAVFGFALASAQAQALVTATQSSSEQSQTSLSNTAANKSQTSAHELPAVEVSAQREANTDARTWDRETLDALPQSNRDLTSVVAAHPAVRLNPTMDGAANAGSLAPEAFSVHGESPHQNQYLIDGVAATNAISPQNDNLNLQVGNVPAFTQAYNLDTQLLEQITLHDSRVPVQFGRFTGGVLDARIKTPQGNNSVGLRWRYNSSNLTKQKIAEKLVDKAEEGTPGFSAIWKKHFMSVHADLRVSETSAVLLSASRRQSDISRVGKVLNQPTTGVANGKTTTLEKRDQRDSVDNFMAKLHTRMGSESSAALTIKRADRQERLVSNFFADTAWTNQQRATGVQAQLDHHIPELGQLHASIGIDHMHALRHSSATELVTQQFADRNLAQYTRGGFGTESLKQRQRSVSLRLDAQPVQMDWLRHHFQAGVELQSTTARFVRAQDSASYRAVQQADGSQRIFSKTFNAAGSVGVRVRNSAFWLSDSVRWTNAAGRWDLTLGVRLEQDNLFKNANFAPRTRLDWQHGQTQVGLGWARYYGLDLLGQALAEGKSALSRTVINNRGVAVNQPPRVTRHRWGDLRTPHSDEWAASLSQGLGEHWSASLSVVHRNSRDAVLRQNDAAGGYTYTNAGGGWSQTTSLGLRSVRPVQMLGAHWSAQLDMSWQHAWRNHDSSAAYDASEEAADDIIEFNGQAMRRDQMPVRQFHQPRTVSLSANARWAQVGLTWNHRLNWRSSRTSVAYIGMSRAGVARYASRRLGSHWSWDTAIHYKPQALRGASFSVEILNLTNRQAPIAAQSAAASANLRYQTGREIWLSAAFDF